MGEVGKWLVKDLVVDVSEGGTGGRSEVRCHKTESVRSLYGEQFQDAAKSEWNRKSKCSLEGVLYLRVRSGGSLKLDTAPDP